ncbi:MAG: MaoC/PaaZ C-terminal domain-containing protein [Polyangiales bacterium]
MTLRTLDRFPGALEAHLALFTRPRRGRSAADVGRVGFRRAGVAPEPERLARYRGLVGLGDDGSLPPFYPQLVAAPLHLAILGDPAFPFPAMGLVHLANAIEELAPIASAAVLDLEAELVSARDVSSGVVFELETRAFVDGALAWRSITTALRRLRSSGKKVGGDAAVARPRPDRRFTFDAPESMGRRYAEVAGDRNPIHQHALLARPFGFPRAIVHGTWTAARTLASFPELLPSRPRRIDVRFRAPVPLPSTVEAIGWARGEGVFLEARSRVDGALHLEIDVARLSP